MLVRCTNGVVVLVRGVNRVRTTPDRGVTRVPARADVPGRTDDVTTRLVETDPPPPPPRATAGGLSSRSTPTARLATPSTIERNIVPSLTAAPLVCHNRGNLGRRVHAGTSDPCLAACVTVAQIAPQG